MVESWEISGKTVDEAIDNALQHLGVTRSEVEIEVLSKGRPGILGFGVEEARIRVSLLPRTEEETEQAQAARETLETLLQLMSIRASVHWVRAFASGDEEPLLALDIRGDDLGVLIGRRGSSLASLQYLVNLMLSRRFRSKTLVRVDVEGYKRRREESLRSLALRVAERVQATGQAVSLEPMSASERRLIHLALRDSLQVVTNSVGEGESRRVAISPKKQGTSP